MQLENFSECNFLFQFYSAASSVGDIYNVPTQPVHQNQDVAQLQDFEDEQPAVGNEDQGADAGQVDEPAAGNEDQADAGQVDQPAAGNDDAGQVDQPAAGNEDQADDARQVDQPAAGNEDPVDDAGQVDQPAAGNADDVHMEEPGDRIPQLDGSAHSTESGHHIAKKQKVQATVEKKGEVSVEQGGKKLGISDLEDHLLLHIFKILNYSGKELLEVRLVNHRFNRIVHLLGLYRRCKIHEKMPADIKCRESCFCVFAGVPTKVWDMNKEVGTNLISVKTLFLCTLTLERHPLLLTN